MSQITKAPARAMGKPRPLSDRQVEELLAHLAGQTAFVFLETSRIDSENHRSYLYTDPQERLVCTAADSIGDFFGEMEARLDRGFYLAGWFGYELGYLLEPCLGDLIDDRRGDLIADLGVYGTPYVYDHRTGQFGSSGPWPTSPAAAANQRVNDLVGSMRLSEEESEYLAKIDRIKELIRSGDTYQVNYTLKLLFDLRGTVDELYLLLRQSQPVGYGAYLRSGERNVLSFSPELFYRRNGPRCTVRPMKGTMHRGRTLSEDRDRIHFLAGDVKNRSENVMIVDMLRNDLGRLCVSGSVKTRSLFDVETYRSLHQMTSTVDGRFKPDITLQETFRALFPCGSVTGAPKIRTMEIIHELEGNKRGVYTGAIGHIAPRRDATLNVPIRTITVEKGRGEMGIGSGIVYDSIPAAEWEECRLKGRFLTEPVAWFRLFETLVWSPGVGYWLLDLHLDRLLQSADYFDLPADRDELRTTLLDRAVSFDPHTAHRARLTLDQGGGAEITTAACPHPNGLDALDRRIPGGTLPRVAFSTQRTDSRSTFLYHKTTHRRLYDEERRRADNLGFFDLLFLNEKGEVTEGTITNIFIRNGDVISTPPVACGLLPGILRHLILDGGGWLTTPAGLRLRVEERTLTRGDVEDAEVVYAGNSVKGLVQVRLPS